MGAKAPKATRKAAQAHRREKETNARAKVFKVNAGRAVLLDIHPGTVLATQYNLHKTNNHSLIHTHSRHHRTTGTTWHFSAQRSLRTWPWATYLRTLPKPLRKSHLDLVLPCHHSLGLTSPAANSLGIIMKKPHRWTRKPTSPQ